MNFTYAISHYFFPGKSNNQKAGILHSPVLFIFTLALIVFQILLYLLPTSGLKILGYASNINPETVVLLTNEKRQQIGLGSLSINHQLSQAAQAKGTHMLANDYWAHVAPDGTQPWAFFIDVGYQYKYAGENLARDFSNPESAVEAWMASPTHKDNMLSGKYTEIGVAVVEGDLNGVETTIIVQLFGSRYVDTTPQLPVASLDVQAKDSLVESAPSPTPYLLATPTPTEEQTVAASSYEVKPPSGKMVVSPFATTKGISLVVIFLLLFAITIDWVITSRKKIPRISGRSFAHFAFLGMVLVIVIIARAGSII